MATDKSKTMVIPDAIHHTDTSETLEYIQGWNDCRQAMMAEQPAQQEPVAWINEANLNSAAIQRNRGGQGDTHTWSETPTWDHSVPLYTSPPAQRTWVGLTEDERDFILRSESSIFDMTEAILKAKNT